MTTIALLGTGLLGAGMVENLLAKGHPVRIWNRTAAKTAPLQQKGAQVAASPADAVRGAAFVHLVLTDDTAVDAVLTAARPGLAAGVPVLDHSTNLPAKVAARCRTLTDVNYLPAPVFMSPQNAREASGLMLLGGPAAKAEAVTPHLQTMTQKVHYTGERTDLPAVLKLAGNSVYFAIAAAMRDVLAIGEGSQVPAEQMLALFDVFKIGTAIPFVGQRVARAGQGQASFELATARKDAALMLQAAGAAPTQLLPHVLAAMDRALARGDGAKDYAVFTRS